MSRTNTAAYESIKASQFIFQNPDRTFPEPGGVLMIDNYKGGTAWSRNLDIKTLTLSGPSSVGVLTYDNQLLVNGSPVGGGGSDLSGGYNITVAGGAINMDISQAVIMNNNPIVGASYVDISGDGESVRLSYSPDFNSINSSKHISISGIANPNIYLHNTISGRSGKIAYNNSFEEITMYGRSSAIVSDYASHELTPSGPTLTSYYNRVLTNIYDPGAAVITSALILTPNNTLQIGSTDVSTNPILLFQGGSGIGPTSDTAARIQYYDASGVEQLRFVSNNYAFNAVPAAASALPTVLGYDTSSGEIKAQPATNGISALSAYTYDASGSLIQSGNITLAPYIPDATGVYMLNFFIEIANSGSTPITFNNTTDSIYLLIGAGADILFPPLVITGIQNRTTENPALTFTYSVTKLQVLQALTGGRSYSFQIFNDNLSGTCSWSSCKVYVRIAKLC